MTYPPTITAVYLSSAGYTIVTDASPYLLYWTFNELGKVTYAGATRPNPIGTLIEWQALPDSVRRQSDNLRLQER